jgi:hypothetical protein
MPTITNVNRDIDETRNPFRGLFTASAPCNSSGAVVPSPETTKSIL